MANSASLAPPDMFMDVDQQGYRYHWPTVATPGRNRGRPVPVAGHERKCHQCAVCQPNADRVWAVQNQSGMSSGVIIRVLLEDGEQSIRQSFPGKNPLPVDFTSDDMMQCAWRGYPRFSRRGWLLPYPLRTGRR